MTLETDDFGFKIEDKQEKKTPRTNQAAPIPDCDTCGGDRFVVVAMRPPYQTAWMKEKGIEPSSEKFIELAPCPDCNADANTTFTRRDGQLVKSPDAGHVREVMQPVGRQSKAGGIVPGWVARWRAARAAKDKRPFPEQLGALRPEEHPPAPVDDRDHWVQEDEYVEGLA